MSAAPRVVLLTGATGFVGKVVLEALLRRRDELGIERVLALVRAGDPEHADARLRADVVSSPCFAALTPGWEKRVEALPGDITRPALGLSDEACARIAAEVTQVVHCAASVEFDLPLREAFAVNTQGALHALDVASACARLEAYVGVSTAYVTPHPAPRTRGVLRAPETLAPLPHDPEELHRALRSRAWSAAEERNLLAQTGHPNTYTLTKCLAEHLVARRAEGVPVTLVRPSIVSACRERPLPGWIDSAAAFAGFVALIGTGRLRAVAGDPDARLDVVPCDAVAERIVAAAFASPAHGELRIEHAVAGLASALPIHLCRERIVDHFNRNPAGGRARVDYVGRQGPVFQLAHALRHELPARAASLWLALRREPRRARAVQKLLLRQRAIQSDFAYFTHATFDFESRAPLAPPLDPSAYLELVCAGVGTHLLSRERRRAS
ncbi:MAG TPA: fatty acyl-CoA reductase [Myxococcota bacterium]|nr:fatty acyl-CoA reductase [Myxococcota bacterium]